MAVLTQAVLVERLCRSKLLEPDQVRELHALEPAFKEPRQLAQEVIRRDWLTAYQINQIAQGKSNDLIVGDYLILERLGEGGMGQVFKARQLKNLQRTVALKVVRKDYVNNPRVIKRFQREINANGLLSHPNIVHAYDADEINGTLYIAMEFVEGIDLSRLVKKEGPLQVLQACDYIRQAALGLQHAHERGMVHRDIKPANLLVTRPTDKRNSGLLPRPHSVPLPYGRGSDGPRPSNAASNVEYPWGIVKILDMGLARWSDPDTGQSVTHLTQMGTVMGTPDYIAPEQASNSRTSDIRADLYSLGCTLYFLLSGQPPFPEGGLLEKLLQHQQDEPKPVEQVRRASLQAIGSNFGNFGQWRVPGEVCAVLAKLLAKYPKDRVQTPAELAEALAQMPERLTNAPVALSPDGTWAKSTPALIPQTATLALEPNPLAVQSEHEAIVAITPKSARKTPWRWQRRWVAAAIVGGALFAAFVLAQLGKRDRPLAGPPSGTDVKSVLQTEPPEEAQWKKLLHKAQQKRPADLDELRQELVRFRAEYFHGTHAQDVPALLASLPSAFDAMQRDKIDRNQWFDWQPKEVVGVLGEWRWLKTGKNEARYMHSLAVSPDGRWVVSGSPDGMIRAWDVATGSEHKTFAHSRQVFRVAFSPDGRTFATASYDGTSKLFDVRTRTLMYTLDKADREVDKDRLRMITSVAFSPDGTLLATAGFDGVVRLWDPMSGQEKKFPTLAGRASEGSFQGDAGKIMSLAFTPDGKHLIWGGENGQVCSADSRSLFVTKAHVRSGAGMAKTLAVSPDGKTVLLGGGVEGSCRLCAWDGKSLSEKKHLQEHKGYIHEAAFAPDGRHFVTVSEDKTAKLWDAKGGTLVESWELRWPILGVAFAPDGRHFLTANANSTVYVFRVPREDKFAAR
ncbi:MAG: serine/threonine protein kinase [Gemmataceae bacterium]|nr:serine/threonine protein kinase [Gemmataceae bacterium]